MRTLLTGFGPFGSITDNPSARIADHFAREGAPGHEFTVRVLPVSFERASVEIGGLLRDGLFDAALLLGVASRTNEIRLERYAHNRTNARIPDVDGTRPAGSEIVPSGPRTYRTPVDLPPLLDSLTSSGLPARISHSAGQYVCNHVYYVGLHTIAESAPSTRCLFVHVPVTGDTGSGIDQQIAGISLLLAGLHENGRAK